MICNLEKTLFIVVSALIIIQIGLRVAMAVSLLERSLKLCRDRYSTLHYNSAYLYYLVSRGGGKSCPQFVNIFEIFFHYFNFWPLL